jgi:hypothetical protein
MSALSSCALPAGIGLGLIPMMTPASTPQNAVKPHAMTIGS